MRFRQQLPGILLAALPITLYFPIGVMYLLVGCFMFACAVRFGLNMLKVRGERTAIYPLCLSMLALVLFEAIFLSSGNDRRWSGMLHYFVFLFFFLFITLPDRCWYQLAKRVFFVGAVYAAIVFSLAKAGVLPDWHIFKNYLVYGGNKSISLGIFMAVAAAWMLNEVAATKEKKTAATYFAAYILVAIAVVFFAVTRTGVLLLMLLSLLVILRWAKINWRTGAVFAALIAALAIGWKSGVSSLERLQRTADALSALSKGQSGSGLNNRVQFIQITGEMIAEKPLFGHGIGSWQQQYPIRAEGLETAFMSTPHNDYLLYAAELGVVGLIILGLILASFLRAAFRAPGRSGNALLLVTVALMIGSMFNAILRDWRFGVPFMLMLAIAYREMLTGSDSMATDHDQH